MSQLSTFCFLFFFFYIFLSCCCFSSSFTLASTSLSRFNISLDSTSTSSDQETGFVRFSRILTVSPTTSSSSSSSSSSAGNSHHQDAYLCSDLPGGDIGGGPAVSTATQFCRLLGFRGSGEANLTLVSNNSALIPTSTSSTSFSTPLLSINSNDRIFFDQLQCSFTSKTLAGCSVRTDTASLRSCNRVALINCSGVGYYPANESADFFLHEFRNGNPITYRPVPENRKDSSEYSSSAFGTICFSEPSLINTSDTDTARALCGFSGFNYPGAKITSPSTISESNISLSQQQKQEQKSALSLPSLLSYLKCNKSSSGTTSLQDCDFKIQYRSSCPSLSQLLLVQCVIPKRSLSPRFLRLSPTIRRVEARFHCSREWGLVCDDQIVGGSSQGNETVRGMLRSALGYSPFGFYVSLSRNPSPDQQFLVDDVVCKEDVVTFSQCDFRLNRHNCLASESFSIVPTGTLLEAWQAVKSQPNEFANQIGGREDCSDTEISIVLIIGITFGCLAGVLFMFYFIYICCVSQYRGNWNERQALCTERWDRDFCAYVCSRCCYTELAAENVGNNGAAAAAADGPFQDGERCFDCCDDCLVVSENCIMRGVPAVLCYCVGNREDDQVAVNEEMQRRIDLHNLNHNNNNNGNENNNNNNNNNNPQPQRLGDDQRAELQLAVGGETNNNNNNLDSSAASAAAAAGGGGGSNLAEASSVSLSAPKEILLRSNCYALEQEAREAVVAKLFAFSSSSNVGDQEGKNEEEKKEDEGKEKARTSATTINPLLHNNNNKNEGETEMEEVVEGNEEELKPTTSILVKEASSSATLNLNNFLEIPSSLARWYTRNFSCSIPQNILALASQEQDQNNNNKKKEKEKEKKKKKKNQQNNNSNSNNYKYTSLFGPEAQFFFAYESAMGTLTLLVAVKNVSEQYQNKLFSSTSSCTSSGKHLNVLCFSSTSSSSSQKDQGRKQKQEKMNINNKKKKKKKKTPSSHEPTEEDYDEEDSEEEMQDVHVNEEDEEEEEEVRPRERVFFFTFTSFCQACRIKNPLVFSSLLQSKLNNDNDSSSSSSSSPSSSIPFSPSTLIVVSSSSQQKQKETNYKKDDDNEENEDEDDDDDDDEEETLLDQTRPHFSLTCSICFGDFSCEIPLLLFSSSKRKKQKLKSSATTIFPGSECSAPGRHFTCSQCLGGTVKRHVEKGCVVLPALECWNNDCAAAAASTSVSAASGELGKDGENKTRESAKTGGGGGTIVLNDFSSVLSHNVLRQWNEATLSYAKLVGQRDIVSGNQKAASITNIEAKEHAGKIRQLLQPNCPQCGLRFQSFSGCVHVHCNCGKDFCGRCLQVMPCPTHGSSHAFLNSAELMRDWSKWRRKRVVDYLQKHFDVEKDRALLKDVLLASQTALVSASIWNENWLRGKF